MAITTNHTIDTTLRKAIDYILNPDKTDAKLLVHAYACTPEIADIEFDLNISFSLFHIFTSVFYLGLGFVPKIFFVTFARHRQTKNRRSGTRRLCLLVAKTPYIWVTNKNKFFCTSLMKI